MECESRIYLENCNCIMFYMPRIANNLNVCGHADNECVAKLRIDRFQKRNKSLDCDCLPGCDSIEYQGEVSSAPILRPIPFLPNLSQQQIENISILQIFFRENLFWAKKRVELFGFTDFLCKFSVTFRHCYFIVSLFSQRTLEVCFLSSWDSALFRLLN